MKYLNKKFTIPVQVNVSQEEWDRIFKGEREMIKAPKNNLTARLDEIQSKVDPEDAEATAKVGFEHDSELARAWKTLISVDANDAIEVYLTNMEAQTLNEITEANITAEVRQFLSGKLRAIYEIQAAIVQFTTAEPKLEDYTQEEESFGDPDAVEGLGDDIAY